MAGRYHERESWSKLVAFESQAEEELIQSTWDVGKSLFVQQFYKRQGSNFSYNIIVDRYWTSLTDTRREGTWVWESTWKFPSSYLHWSGGQPDNYLNNEDCMMYGGSYKSAWNDGICSDLAFAICEAQP